MGVYQLVLDKMMLRRWRGKVGWRLALALLVLWVAGGVRVPLRAELAGGVRAPPHALAAHLADFNNLQGFYQHIESWWVEEQWSNYTSWRYKARFSCGARCTGQATVTAHDQYTADAAAPAHGSRAHTHKVLLELTTCWNMPLLPWPAFCDEVSVESVVSGDGAGGARYAEVAAARARPAAALAGRGAELRAQRRRHLQHLQAIFG